MKVMCISDIHGSINNLKRALERYKRENAEKLIILGDFSSYFFSSTDFEMAEILNDMAGVIIAVKGNCDNSQIDNLFHFDLSFIKNIEINGIDITLTHGHIYNRNNLPENCGKIFLYGHTHVGDIEVINDRIIANPGSIAKPRSGTIKSYIVIDERSIILKTLTGKMIKKLDLTI